MAAALVLALDTSTNCHRVCQRSPGLVVGAVTCRAGEPRFNRNSVIFSLLRNKVVGKNENPRINNLRFQHNQKLTKLTLVALP